MALCSSKWRTRVANSTCSTGLLNFVHQLVFVHSSFPGIPTIYVFLCLNQLNVLPSRQYI